MASISTSSSSNDRLAGSHEVRSGFERWALVSFIAIVCAVCVAALVGAIIPPVHQVSATDWGQTIVTRVVQLKDTILDMLGALLSGVGVTFTRGHLDARLDNKPG